MNRSGQEILTHDSSSLRSEVPYSLRRFVQRWVIGLLLLIIFFSGVHIINTRYFEHVINSITRNFTTLNNAHQFEISLLRYRHTTMLETMEKNGSLEQEREEFLEASETYMDSLFITLNDPSDSTLIKEIQRLLIIYVTETTRTSGGSISLHRRA